MPDISVRMAKPTELACLLDLYRHLHRDDPAPDAAMAEVTWSALTNSSFIKVIVAEVGAAKFLIFAHRQESWSYGSEG